EISWSATDRSPAAYRILKDNVELKKGFLNLSSESIVVDVDGLAAGSFNYEIEFYEASEMSASDVVTVTVNESDTTTSTDTTTDTNTTTDTDTGTDTGTGDFISENMMLIISVGGVTVVIIVIVIIIKKK
ncbi:MAG: hypothetical protein ACTSPB_12790, partial [Candidatus Thorarchaeota archaeon]